MNNTCCDDYDNNDYSTASYCGKCGKWLEPKGWTMLTENPSRSLQIYDDIDLNNLISATIELSPCDKNFLLAIEDFVCFSGNFLKPLNCGSWDRKLWESKMDKSCWIFTADKVTEVWSQAGGKFDLENVNDKTYKEETDNINLLQPQRCLDAAYRVSPYYPRHFEYCPICRSSLVSTLGLTKLPWASPCRNLDNNRSYSSLDGSSKDVNHKQTAFGHCYFMS